MKLIEQYEDAAQLELIARTRRVVALRAMRAMGMTQRDIATALGISQPAVSQQLTAARSLTAIHPEVLMKAAAPILKQFCEDRGYRNLAVFGSVARGDAHAESDIDLLVDSPLGTSSFEFMRFHAVLEQILDRKIDLVDYGGLKSPLDNDIRRDLMML